jgi:hypothetical protein
VSQVAGGDADPIHQRLHSLDHGTDHPASSVRLRIPTTEREPLVRLALLPEEVFSRVLDATRAYTTLPSRAGLIETFAEAITIDRDDAADVVSAVLELATFRAYRDVDAVEVATDVARSKDLDLSPEGRATLGQRLQVLLEDRIIAITAKAVDVITEHAHVFHSARILTDIRPVFTKQPSQPPDAAVLVQMLKIDYHENGIKSFYVALDSQDLRKLRDVIDRAVEKTDSLRGHLGGAALQVLDVSQEH